MRSHSIQTLEDRERLCQGIRELFFALNTYYFQRKKTVSNNIEKISTPLFFMGTISESNDAKSIAQSYLTIERKKMILVVISYIQKNRRENIGQQSLIQVLSYAC